MFGQDLTFRDSTIKEFVKEYKGYKLYRHRIKGSKKGRSYELVHPDNLGYCMFLAIDEDKFEEYIDLVWEANNILGRG